MGVIVYLDTLLVPLSLFITIGYHVFLWHTFKKNPCRISVGVDALRRKAWFQDMKEGDDKKGMLAVQSLRNTLMATIFTASISIVINLSVAALTNNAYKASHLLHSEVFGSQSGRILAVKYGSASLFLTSSFFCSSLAIGFLVDANFLVNVYEDATGTTSYFNAYARSVLERGFMMAMIGSRLLYVTFPLLLWMFGPLAVVISSLGLVWVFYQFDFISKVQGVW